MVEDFKVGTPIHTLLYRQRNWCRVRRSAHPSHLGMGEQTPVVRVRRLESYLALCGALSPPMGQARDASSRLTWLTAPACLSVCPGLSVYGR